MSENELDFDGLIVTREPMNEDMEAVLYLKGYIDTMNSTKLSNFLTLFLKEERGLKSITLNMKELTYISSTGIGCLTNLLLLCKKMNIELKLKTVGKKVLDVISLLGFTSFFNVED